MKRLVLGLLLLLGFAAPAFAQGADAPTYVACSAAQAVTAAADMLHLEAGPEKAIRVLRIWIVPGTQTTAGYHQIVIRRTTSASTGGSTVVASPLDPNDAAFTGIVRYGATGGGTDGVTIWNGAYFVPTATTIGLSGVLVVYDATQMLFTQAEKPLWILKGGTTGLEIHNNTGGAGGANHYACVQFTEQR